MSSNPKLREQLVKAAEYPLKSFVEIVDAAKDGELGDAENALAAAHFVETWCGVDADGLWRGYSGHSIVRSDAATRTRYVRALRIQVSERLALMHSPAAAAQA